MRFLVAAILVAAVTILGTSMFATTAASTSFTPTALSLVYDGVPEYCMEHEWMGERCQGPPPKDSFGFGIESVSECAPCTYTEDKIVSGNYCEDVVDEIDADQNIKLVWTDAACKCDYANDDSPNNPPEECPLAGGGRNIQCKCSAGECAAQGANACPEDGVPFCCGD